jgi:hypothetical protein
VFRSADEKRHWSPDCPDESSFKLLYGASLN